MRDPPRLVGQGDHTPKQRCCDHQHKQAESQPARGHVALGVARIGAAKRGRSIQTQHQVVPQQQQQCTDRQIAVKRIDDVDAEWRGGAFEACGQRKLHAHHCQPGIAECDAEIPPEPRAAPRGLRHQREQGQRDQRDVQGCPKRQLADPAARSACRGWVHGVIGTRSSQRCNQRFAEWATADRRLRGAAARRIFADFALCAVAILTLPTMARKKHLPDPVARCPGRSATTRAGQYCRIG